VLRVHHARRVGRVVEQEHPGLLRQRGVELRGGELVVLLGRARQQLDLGADDLGDVHVAGPVGRGEGDGVALVEQRLGQVVEDVLGADAGGAVVARVALQAQPSEVAEEGVEQRVRAAVAAVLARIALERFAGGGIDVLAGQEVGDADREADDVAAFGLQALGRFGHHHDRAGLGATHPLGELGHCRDLGFWGYRGAACGCPPGARKPLILAPRPGTGPVPQADISLSHSATRSAFAASTVSASPSIFTDLMASPCFTASTTSMPSVTLPNTVCLPSSQSVFTWVMKNWLPLVLGPALAMESTPRSWRTPLLVSSSNL